MKALIPLPNCETCGKPVKKRWRLKGVPTRFCSNACVPRQIRADGGRRGRVRWMIDHRIGRFRAQLKRIQALPRVTGEELVAVFAEIDRKAWLNGYSACEDKWQRRAGRYRMTDRSVDLASRQEQAR
jgi:hypothetical protein